MLAKPARCSATAPGSSCDPATAALGGGLRIYETIDEVRATVRDFVARYNTEWLIEKNGLRSPSSARNAWRQTVMKAAA